LAGGKPVRDRFLHFSQPRLSEREIAAVEATLRSGWLTTASRAREFESRFKAYTGASHAVALNSCTAAMFLSLKALDIGPGDEVITTPLTFSASVNVIEHAGAKPVFADIDPDTWCIDPSEVEKSVTDATRAILMVHLYGRSCEMNELMEIARKHDLAVIQDCAHAIETVYHRRNVGSLGDLACYSFYATKNVTTGEGGMVTTGREDWADRIRSLALHGLDRTAYDRFTEGGKVGYDLHEPGYKYNMPDILAALGIEGLAMVEERLKIREKFFETYRTGLSDLPGVTLPPEPAPDTRHARHIFACAIKKGEAGIDRDTMIEALKAENIGTGIHFIPVHLFTFYRDKYRIDPDDLPHATALGDGLISLPLTPYLTDGDVDEVIRAVRRIVLYHSSVRC
jgi:dTDP-4-amino-4,6-dideoxygalactose transaminase